MKHNTFLSDRSPGRPMSAWGEANTLSGGLPQVLRMPAVVASGILVDVSSDLQGCLRCCVCPPSWLLLVCPGPLCGVSARPGSSRVLSAWVVTRPERSDGSEETSKHGSAADQQPKGWGVLFNPVPGLSLSPATACRTVPFCCGGVCPGQTGNERFANGGTNVLRTFDLGDVQYW